MKRYIAVMSALALCLTLCGGIAEDISGQLPDVVLQIKTVLDIGDEYTEFSSDNYDGMWYLNWSGDAGNVDVSCDSSGTIYNYYYYTYDRSYNNGFSYRYPSIGQAEQLAIAGEFLDRVIASEGEGWVIQDVDAGLINDNDTAAHMEARLTVSGVPTDVMISLSVDTVAGKVTYFYRTDGHDVYMPFDGDLTENVSEAEALAMLSDTTLLEKVYMVTGSDEMARLVYKPVGGGQYLVRASDGELIDLSEDSGEYYNYAYAADIVAMGAEEEGAKQLTEAELKGISAYDGALSIEALDAMLRKMPEMGLDGYEMYYSAYFNNDDELAANIRYRHKLSVVEKTLRGLFGDYEEYDERTITVNAVTGQLQGVYSYYPGVSAARNNADAAALNAQAEAIIAAQFPEYAGNLRLASSEYYSYDHSWTSEMCYKYVRVHEGYDFEANYISMELNADTGVIDSLSMYWDAGQEFQEPDESDIITSEAAMEAYLTGFEFERALVSWPVDEDDTYEFMYGFQLRDVDHVYAVDALTGDTYKNGYESGEFTYDDVAEDATAIITLGQYGIGFSGGKFQPDAPFTMRDAMVFVYQARGNYNGDIETRSYEELRDSAKYFDWMPDKAEEAILTRGELAYELVCLAGYEKAAELTGIYSCGFADDEEILEEEYGGIAIAYALGIIVPDAEGNIAADTPLTRAEAAEIFHRFFSIK